MTPFDPRICALGEGPLWHPEAGALLWFDIQGKRLLSQSGGAPVEWQFDEHASAAGWVDETTLLMATETGLWRFDLRTAERQKLCDLEAENTVTRSNDGRADPWGGFWIGTMGKAAEPGAGAIYRYAGGELRQIAGGITVSNAICFAPDRSCAHYTDTVTQKIMRQPLDPQTGWPVGEAQVHIDLTGTRLFPDGAVTDADGNLWVAMWGAGCVICFDAAGQELRRIELPVRQPTCPAFGGPDLRDLYVTSATQGLDQEALSKRPLSGATFVIPDVAQGLAEPKVLL